MVIAKSEDPRHIRRVLFKLTVCTREELKQKVRTYYYAKRFPVILNKDVKEGYVRKLGNGSYKLTPMGIASINKRLRFPKQAHSTWDYTGCEQFNVAYRTIFRKTVKGAEIARIQNPVAL